MVEFELVPIQKKMRLTWLRQHKDTFDCGPQRLVVSNLTVLITPFREARGWNAQNF